MLTLRVTFQFTSRREAAFVKPQPQHGANVVVVVAMAIAVTGYAIISSLGLRAAPTEDAAPAVLSEDSTGEARPAAEKPEKPTKGKTAKDFEKKLFTGKVIFAQAALKKRGIKVAEEMQSQAVLETPSGELIPIAADWRGRAFYQDKRLRDRPVELVGYRRPGLPYLQVLVVFVLDEKGRRQEMDYWCEICSIPMYEIKACECCQAYIDLRLRPGKLPAYLSLPPKKHSPKTNAADAPKASGGKSSE